MNDYEKQQKKDERDAEKERKLLLARVRDVAQTPAGKDFIWELLSMAGIYATTFTGNSQGAYNEGRRSVGLDIMQLLEEMDPTFYPTLLLQQRKKK